MSDIREEIDRRKRERRRLVQTAAFESEFEPVSAFVLDLSASGFRAVANGKRLPDTVHARLNLPDESSPLKVRAQLRWSVELKPNSSHGGYEILEFENAEGERQLLDFLNTSATISSSGVETLRQLEDAELRRLSILSEISGILNSKLAYSQSLQRITELMRDSVGAERGLVLLDRGGPRPSVEVAVGPENLTQKGLAYSETLVREVLEKGKAVLSLDVSEDEALEGVASLQILGTRSVLCVPMKTGTRNFGLIYLDSSIKRGLFSESDLVLMSIVADISAAAIERNHFLTQVVQSEKMAALGTMVAGLAHDLKNPLSGIIGLAEFWRDGEATQGDAEQVVSEAERCIKLVDDLLLLSRGGEVEFTELALFEVLETVENLVGHDLKKKSLQFKVECPKELPLLRGNARQLVQVFLNLVTNAIALLPKNGAIEVLAAQDSSLLRVSVMDDGEGISPENLSRIFDPFVTTREEGHGLGLSIVQRLVEEHGGFVMAQNRPEGGAVFTVELPMAERA